MEVNNAYDDFVAQDTDVVAITFEGNRSEAIHGLLNLRFPIAIDEDRKAYRRYGLDSGTFSQIWNVRVLRKYLALLFKGRRLQRPPKGSDLSQLGGDFLIDEDGKLVWLHRSSDPADRPTVAELLSVAAS